MNEKLIEHILKLNPVYPSPYKYWEIGWDTTAAGTGDETLTCALVN